MKNLLKISMILALSAFAILLQAQDQNIQESYFTAINPGEANTVFLNLKGEVEMEIWDEDYILLYMDVSAEVPNSKVLKELRDDGRYLLKKEMTFNDYLLVSQPNINKIIRINGQALNEEILYKVKMPIYLDVEISGRNDMVVYQEELFFNEQEGNLFSMTQIEN